MLLQKEAYGITNICYDRFTLLTEICIPLIDIYSLYVDIMINYSFVTIKLLVNS